MPDHEAHGAEMRVAVATREAPRPEPKPLEQWNVVLLDDDDHTYEYVIGMMCSIFGHAAERGVQIAKRVDKDGRAVCLTTHRELAELKRDLIHGFGADPLLASSLGPMRAVLEPAGDA